MGVVKGLGIAVVAWCLIAGTAVAMSRTGAIDCIQGKGAVETVRRDLSGFDEIEIRGAFDLNVACGRPRRVAISAQKNLLPHIRTKTAGRKLIIDTDAAVCTRQELRVDIAVETLKALKIDGAVDASVTGIGAARFDLALDGSGDVHLSGKAGILGADLMGAGDLSARGLLAQQATVRLDGSGEVAVHVTGRLSAVINGAGDITVYGDPKRIDETITGVGEVIRP